MVVWFLYLAYDMGLHRLIFVGRNLDSGKKLTRYEWWIVLGWTVLAMNVVENITPISLQVPPYVYEKQLTITTLFVGPQNQDTVEPV